MSLSSWPKVCPKCGSEDFHELARVEAGEFSGPCEMYPEGDPPTDEAIYACRTCYHEWQQ